MKSLWLVPPQGEPIAVGKSPTVVGRDAACDIAVAHESISRRHAIVERSGSEWAVADQNERERHLDRRPADHPRLPAPRPAPALRRRRLRGEAGGGRGGRPARAAGPADARARPSARDSGTPADAAADAPAADADAAAAADRRPGPAVSRAQAAELLGIAPGASAPEIRRQYQRIYNDYQIRLTNAPTASLKRMYQKNLQELKAAVEVLAPGLLARDGS